MTKPSTEEQLWQVLLCRKEIEGWKRQEFSAASSSSSSSSSLAGKNRRHVSATRITSVAPRIDCIVFPELRQKFSLKSEADRGTVIRRDHKILLVSKRRARALLLEFRSLEDCLAFSDQFTRLNPRKALLPSSRNNNDAVSDHPSRQENSQAPNGKSTSPAVVGEEGHRDVVSWIVKMLHDKSFLSYVQKIENYIIETEDGMQILKGLEQGELPPLS